MFDVLARNVEIVIGDTGSLCRPYSSTLLLSMETYFFNYTIGQKIWKDKMKLRQGSNPAFIFFLTILVICILLLILQKIISITNSKQKENHIKSDRNWSIEETANNERRCNDRKIPRRRFQRKIDVSNINEMSRVTGNSGDHNQDKESLSIISMYRALNRYQDTIDEAISREQVIADGALRADQDTRDEALSRVQDTSASVGNENDDLETSMKLRHFVGVSKIRH